MRGTKQRDIEKTKFLNNIGNFLLTQNSAVLEDKKRSLNESIEGIHKLKK